MLHFYQASETLVFNNLACEPWCFGRYCPAMWLCAYIKSYPVVPYPWCGSQYFLSCPWTLRFWEHFMVNIYGSFTVSVNEHCQQFTSRTILLHVRIELWCFFNFLVCCALVVVVSGTLVQFIHASDHGNCSPEWCWQSQLFSLVVGCVRCQSVVLMAVCFKSSWDRTEGHRPPGLSRGNSTQIPG